jgi:hypothetical protein
MVHRIFQMEHDDARALQRLGAAVVLMWARIPQALREDIVMQCQGIEGMANPDAVAKRVHDLVRQSPPD